MRASALQELSPIEPMQCAPHCCVLGRDGRWWPCPEQPQPSSEMRPRPQCQSMQSHRALQSTDARNGLFQVPLTSSAKPKEDHAHQNSSILNPLFPPLQVSKMMVWAFRITSGILHEHEVQAQLWRMTFSTCRKHTAVPAQLTTHNC